MHSKFHTFQKPIAAVGTKLRVSRPLEIKGSVIRGTGKVASTEARTVLTLNIVFQWQYFVAFAVSGNVFGLRSIFVCFPSTSKQVT
jgi:hypothetical protein